MSKSKIMGIVGNCLLIVFSVLAIALMALPMFRLTIGEVSGDLGTVYEWMNDVFGAQHIPGELTTSLVFFVLVDVVACVMIVLGILGLVAVITDNKKLNFTFINRIISIVLMLFAFVGVVCAAVYGVNNSVVGVSTLGISAGTILPLCFGLLACLSSFVAPTKKKQ